MQSTSITITLQIVLNKEYIVLKLPSDPNLLSITATYWAISK